MKECNDTEYPYSCYYQLDEIDDHDFAEWAAINKIVEDDYNHLQLNAIGFGCIKFKHEDNLLSFKLRFKL